METQNDPIRLLLQRELTVRCGKNQNYSLRSFARQIGVPVSSLSSILSGKRPISPKMKKHLAAVLGIALDESKNETKKNFNNYSVDSFHIISDWYHFAILELMKLKTYKQDSKWIARCLGITTSEVKIAFERLARVGILEEHKGKFKDVSGGNNTWLKSGYTDSAFKRLQIRLLEKAIENIMATPYELRNNTSMTMAINQEDLPKAKKLIADFRRQFSEILEKDRNKLNSVYQLAIAFFPLVKQETVL